MRLLCSTLLLCITFLCYSQSHNPLINSGESILKGIELHDKGNYERAIETYLKVNENDTNYVLMLYKVSLSYIADSQFHKAIEACQEGLLYKSAHIAGFYNNMGTAYDQLGETDIAVETFAKGLELYPYNYELLFNSGLAYYRNKQYAEAIPYLEMVLQNHPAHGRTHLILGLIAIMQGHITHAMMSYSTYLMANPTASNAINILHMLEEIALGRPVVDAEDAITPFQTNSEFEEIDQLIMSKIALNKSYKAKVKLELGVSKQFQLVFEKFRYKARNDDIWMQTYGPMFARLAKDDLLEPFIYVILIPTENDKVLKWVRRNNKKIGLFVDAVKDELFKMNAYKMIDEDGKPTKYRSWYSENKLESLGNVVGNDYNKKVGYWRQYYKSGMLANEGPYNSRHQMEGLWKLYREEDGSLAYEVNYKNEKLHGKVTGYNKYGNVSFEFSAKDGKSNGPSKTYFECGQLREEFNMRDGERDGEYKSYFYNGQLESEATYKAGLFEGPMIIYNVHGGKEKESQFKGGRLQGAHTEYHIDGTVALSGQFKDNEPDGVWKTYYPNGNPRVEYVHQADGKKHGLLKRYHENGNLHSEENYVSGEMNGLHTTYDEDGKLHFKEDYRKDKLTSIEYFDKTGKSLGKTTIPSRGTAKFKVYDPDGVHVQDAEYLNGMMHGEWKVYYSRSGKVDKVIQYKEGKRNGKYKEYYVSGQLYAEASYKDHKLDGYYKSYFANGQEATEGWYVDGTRDGAWYNYYPDGTLEQSAFYSDGSLHGKRIEYDPNGKKVETEIFDNGLYVGLITYDTAGTIHQKLDFPAGSGPYNLTYGNGDILLKGEKLCGKSHGPFKWYYPGGILMDTLYLLEGRRTGAFAVFYENGKLSRSGTYKNGHTHGKSVGYFESGKISRELYYTEGDRDSVWTYYYENGKIDATVSYKKGERYGVSKYYDEAGELMFEKYHNQGLVHYRYLDKSGNLTDPIVLDKGTGKVVAYYKNGNKSAEEEYRHGQLHGKRMQYHSNGKVSVDEQFENHNRVGIRKTYYANGKLKAEEAYEADQYHGTCKYYRNDGSLEKTIEYRFGSKNGPEIHYNKSGKAVKTIYYRNGRVQI